MIIVILDSSAISRKEREKNAQIECSHIIKKENAKIIFIKHKNKKELLKRFRQSSFRRDDRFLRFAKEEDYDDIRKKEKASKLINNCLQQEIRRICTTLEEVEKDYHLILGALYHINGNKAVILTSDSKFIDSFYKIKEQRKEECRELQYVEVKLIQNGEIHER